MDWKHSSMFKQGTVRRCSTELLYWRYRKISQWGAHASFLQCSAYIVLGQDDGLIKINLKISWNHRVRRIRYSKVNMAVSCPRTFLLRSHSSYPSWQEVRILSKKFIYNVLNGVLKINKGEGGIPQISQKEKLF